MGAGFESCTCPVGFIALDGLLAGASVPRKPWGKPASCGPRSHQPHGCVSGVLTCKLTNHVSIADSPPSCPDPPPHLTPPHPPPPISSQLRPHPKPQPHPSSIHSATRIQFCSSRRYFSAWVYVHKYALLSDSQMCVPS